MLHTVKDVKYVKEYMLKITFDDGKIKIVDFEERLKTAKNLYLPLRDVNFFKQVQADGTTIVWSNGIDICPDTLYERGKEIN